MGAKQGFSAGVEFNVGGIDKSIAGLGRLEKAWMRLGKASKVHGKATSRGFGAQSGAIQGLSSMLGGVFRGFNSILNASGDFEQALAGLGVVTRASSKTLTELKETAIQAGLSTQFSPQESIDGLQKLATGGFTAAQSMKMLIPVLDLAAGSLGKLSVEKAGQAVGGVLKAFGKGAAEAVPMADKLLRITQMTNLQAGDFQQAFQKSGATAREYGQSFEDASISIGLMRNMNIAATVAGTAYSESVRRLGSMTLAQNAMTEAGVDIYDKQTGKMRNIIDIMMDFSKASKRLGMQETKRISNIAFGARGMAAFSAISKATYTTIRDGTEVTFKGIEAVKAMRKELENSAGAADLFKRKLLDTYKGIKTLIKSNLQTWAVEVGESFTSSLKPVAEFVYDGLNVALKAFRTLSKPVKDVLTGVVLVGGAFAAAAVAWGVISSFVLPTLVVGFSALVPMLPVMLGLAAAGALMYKAWTSNFGGFRDAVKKIGMGFKGLWAIFTSWKDGTSKLPLELADSLKKAGIFDWVVRVGGWLGRMKGFVVDVSKLFSEWGGKVAHALLPTLRGLWSIASAVGYVFLDIGRALGLIDDKPLEGTRKSTEGVSRALNTALGWIRKFGVLSEVVFKGAASWIRDYKKHLVVAVTWIKKVTWWVATALYQAWGKTWVQLESIWGSLGRIYTAFSRVYDSVMRALEPIAEAFGDIKDSVLEMFPGLDRLHKKFDVMSWVVKRWVSPIQIVASALEKVAWVVEKVLAPTWTWFYDTIWGPIIGTAINEIYKLNLVIQLGANRMASMWIGFKGYAKDALNWAFDRLLDLGSLASKIIPGLSFDREAAKYQATGGMLGDRQKLWEQYQVKEGPKLGMSIASPQDWLKGGPGLSPEHRQLVLTAEYGTLIKKFLHRSQQSYVNRETSMLPGHETIQSLPPPGMAAVRDAAIAPGRRGARGDDQLYMSMTRQTEAMEASEGKTSQNTGSIERLTEQVDRLTEVMMSLPEGVSRAMSGGQSSLADKYGVES